MNRLTDTCSKADEMNHWREFLNQLPPCSYLALYLQDSSPMIEDAMRNDMSCDAISDLRKQRAAAQQDVSDVRKLLADMREQRDTLQRDIDRLKRDAVRLRDAFDDAMAGAKLLLREADGAHSMAVKSINRALIA